MLRARAVVAILVEEVAHVRVADVDGPENGAVKRSREAVRYAEKRALAMVVAALATLLILFLTHPGGPRLSLQGEEVIFAVGVLLVALFAGFRLGQWEKYRAVGRSVDELTERYDPLSSDE